MPEETLYEPQMQLGEVSDRHILFSFRFLFLFFVVVCVCRGILSETPQQKAITSQSIRCAIRSLIRGLHQFIVKV